VSFFEHPHRRYNPLTEEWVLCSPQRTERPWQGQIEKPAAAHVPSYDPNCYLCPRNERAGHVRNPDYTSTFAFDNDFAALRQNNQDWQINEEDLLIAHAEPGICRVLCFSPHHDLTLPQMQLSELRLVVDAWAEEAHYLGTRDGINYVQIFENKGQAMGCSNPHPHGQIWATKHVPDIPAAKVRSQQAYFRSHNSDLLGDYVALELARQERLICRNEHWVALVPFWAVWPFEAMLIPMRLVPDLASLNPEERDALADIIRRLTVRYDNLFNTSFPYSMGWHSCPTDGQAHPYWRLHAVYYPPLLRSATVRKFQVGYEMTAEPQRDITAEQAARQLREMSEKHYLSSFV
jgi:UDPglucose--hexose-1-phosphate uridylyltransferase